LPVLTAAIVVGTTCCSVNGTDDASAQSDAETLTPAIYEGEWTVNKQVVDTARLVVGTPVRVRLPEEYLLSLCATTDDNAIFEPQSVATEIWLYEQGYSEQSQYLTFSSEALQSSNAALRFNVCSFVADVNGKPHRFGLLCQDNANAVIQKITGQWTLGIPLCAFLITDMATGQSDVYELPATVNLFYSTKQRVY